MDEEICEAGGGKHHEEKHGSIRMGGGGNCFC